MLANSNLSVTLTTMWKCGPCGKAFKSIEMLDEHKKSKKHKKTEKEFLIANPNSSVSSMFKSIQHEQSSDILTELHKSIHGHSHSAPSVEEDHAVHTATTLESLRICLFCNKECEGVKKNLDHMRLAHGFFILDIECLINLKGLLAYVAERIQLGKICLYCDKQFKSADKC